MILVLHLSSRWNNFLVSLSISIQFFFPWVAGCHLIIWDVFHKTISRLFFSLLVFQQLRSTLLLRMPSQTLLWQKLAFSSPFFYFNYLYSILSFRRHCGVVLFTHLLVCSGSCSFRAYPLTGLCAILLKFFSPYQSLASLSTGVLSEIFLTRSIHLIVPEAVFCNVIKYLLILSSYYLTLFLFNRSAFNLVLPCSSFLTECFQLRSSPLYSFLDLS